MAFDLQMITQVYMRIKERVPRARAIVGRPLTYTEKILYSHLFKDINENSSLGNETYVDFVPDRVAMQDATGQMALLQFIQSGKNKTAVPSTVHCDHLIQANSGAYKDLQKSINENNEIFNFLQSVSTKYGIGFWLPGAGIIHQVILENYAFPGGMIIGTDSHTPNAGGLGMLAIGVGGADAVDVMAGMPWELKFPKLIGVLLKGELNGWSSPKDIILKVASILSVIGGTDAILEYFGEGAEKLSCTGKGTICNMGAEVGATTSIFGYDTASENYLKITGRADIADLASDIKEHLRADPQVYENPQKYFDRLITIDLSELEPHINGPFTPDLAWPISKFAQAVEENNWPKKLEVGLIGSCTNSSYEDISRSASIAKQAIEKNLKFKSKFTLTPGSEQVRYTLLRDGYLNFFEKIGALVLANACGPCIGQWKRDINDPSRKNSILTSFNRNFAKRNDGNANTHAFIASPEIVTAMALAGNLNFNPLTDTIQNEKGQHIKLIAPEGFELPPKGFSVENSGYRALVKDGKNIIISISPNSERLQLLKPFRAWDGENIMKARLLIKVKGKCTTDHISMAGPWLKYRGHLDNISNNLLIGAINAFNGKINLVKNLLNDIYGEVPTTARAYKAAGIPTVIIGDENYGEGSSREHAAMEPRHLGIRVVLARSFARIHETNLKKQGIIALTFYDKDDYEKIQEEDWFNFTDLKYFAPNKLVSVELIHKDKRKDTIKACHSYNENQIEWVKAGSALNMIKMRDKKN